MAVSSKQDSCACRSRSGGFRPQAPQLRDRPRREKVKQLIELRLRGHGPVVEDGKMTDQGPSASSNGVPI